MFLSQKERFFPMPDYDLTNPNRVVVRVFGKVLDENYTRILIEKADMDLTAVILLDKVQKKYYISKENHSYLKKLKLVEGRYPNIYVSSSVASITNLRVQYIKHRAFEDAHYKKMILAFIKEYKSASRRDIDNLLMAKLSDALNDVQKNNKIRNLLTALRQEKKISNTGSKAKPKWVLVKI